MMAICHHSLAPTDTPMTNGRTPKQTISLSESSWMPKRFSSSVRFFFVLATIPSNMSQKPENIRHMTAAIILP